MRRRGLRYEVDEPSARQERNRGWLAEHPWQVATVSGVVFALGGVMFAVLKDLAGLSPIWGGVIGAGAGTALGWAFSVEHRRRATWRTKVLYGLVCVVAIGLLLAMKAA